MSEIANATISTAPRIAPTRCFRRDNSVILIALLAISLLAWAYLLHMDKMMREASAMSAMGMALDHPWERADLLMTFLMWAVMMIGMMVPSAMPMIMAFATVNRNRAKRGGPCVATGVFLAGYLMIWIAFSLLASVVQLTLHSAALLSPETLTVVPWMQNGLLISAGVFQLSSLKNICLSRCQSPFDFLGSAWREGTAGALWMGVNHGAFCVGCCWLLMMLLFVAGVMNLFWVAVIAAYVLAEKLLPRGSLVSHLGAISCLVVGIVGILVRFRPIG